MSAGYWVWRRDDGYVSCTRYDPSNRHPGGSTFESLFVSDEWTDELVALIEAERLDPRHAAAVASWEA